MRMVPHDNLTSAKHLIHDLLQMITLNSIAFSLRIVEVIGSNQIITLAVMSSDIVEEASLSSTGGLLVIRNHNMC